MSRVQKTSDDSDSEPDMTEMSERDKLGESLV